MSTTNQVFVTVYIVCKIISCKPIAYQIFDKQGCSSFIPHSGQKILWEEIHLIKSSYHFIQLFIKIHLDSLLTLAAHKSHTNDKTVLLWNNYLVNENLSQSQQKPQLLPAMTCLPLPLPSLAPSMIPGRSRS